MVINIPKSDLRFRAYKSSGPGGQHRNTTESAIEVLHIPTGIKACAALKSQHQSRKAALRVLIARLTAYYQTPKERFGAPPIRVRTYHEPDNRVTDHASGRQWSYRETVGRGRLEGLIEDRADFLCAQAIGR